MRECPSCSRFRRTASRSTFRILFGKGRRFLGRPLLIIFIFAGFVLRFSGVVILRAGLTMKIALINMPFTDFTLPSIGISLLQAGLRRQGMACDTYYLNLQFAARIGCLSYWEVNYYSPWTALTGEWLFAEDLFGPDPGRDQSYIE